MGMHFLFPYMGASTLKKKGRGTQNTYRINRFFGFVEPAPSSQPSSHLLCLRTSLEASVRGESHSLHKEHLTRVGCKAFPCFASKRIFFQRNHCNDDGGIRLRFLAEAGMCLSV